MPHAARSVNRRQTVYDLRQDSIHYQLMFFQINPCVCLYHIQVKSVKFDFISFVFQVQGHENFNQPRLVETNFTLNPPFKITYLFRT